MGNCCNEPSINMTQSDVEINEYTKDSITCGICYGLFCETSTLKPCMHSFCGGCISEWHNKSNSCPFCREFIQQVKRNNKIDDKVQQFVFLFPLQARPLTELEELQAKNTITYDTVFKKPVTYVQIENYHGIAQDSDNDENDDGVYDANGSDYVISTWYPYTRVLKADIETYTRVTGASITVARETIAGAIVRNLSPALEYAISFHYIRAGQN